MIEAAQIESHVVVQNNAVVGRMAILKEGCVILEGSVVAGGMVVPPGCVAGGKPARVLGEVGVGWGLGEDGGEGGRGGDLREVWRAAGKSSS